MPQFYLVPKKLARKAPVLGVITEGDAEAKAACDWVIEIPECPHYTATIVATTALQKRANDASLLFWRAYATLKEGHLSDAVRELDALRSRHGVQLPALICLKQAHDAAELQDREAIEPLITLLESGEGRVVEEVWPTLVEMTDQPFSDDPSLWRRWWGQVSGGYVLPTDAELEKRRSERAAANARGKLAVANIACALPVTV